MRWPGNGPLIEVAQKSPAAEPFFFLRGSYSEIHAVKGTKSAATFLRIIKIAGSNRGSTTAVIKPY
jgi:hypothetical protein